MRANRVCPSRKGVSVAALNLRRSVDHDSQIATVSLQVSFGQVLCEDISVRVVVNKLLRVLLQHGNVSFKDPLNLYLKIL